jgi:hypothetical protein
MRRRSETSDTMPLISTVPSGSRRTAARDPVRPGQAVLDVGLPPGGERFVERVVGGAVGRMQRRLPVLHLRIGLGTAEQAVRARPLEELLDAAVGLDLRQVDVLADDVQQAGEAIARLRQPRDRVLASRDVGDDAADQHGAVGPAERARAVLDHARHAVEGEHAVLRLRVLATQQRAVERLVRLPVVGMDARLPELARGHAGRRLAAEERDADRRRRVGHEVTVRRHHARVYLLLEQVEDVGELRVDEPESRRDAVTEAARVDAQPLGAGSS